MNGVGVGRGKIKYAVSKKLTTGVPRAAPFEYWLYHPTVLTNTHSCCSSTVKPHLWHADARGCCLSIAPVHYIFLPLHALKINHISYCVSRDIS